MLNKKWMALFASATITLAWGGCVGYLVDYAITQIVN